MDQSRWIRKPAHGISVVFIHGVLSNSKDAWLHPNGTWWPQLLADEPARELEETGIYVFDYRSDRSSGNYNLFDAATSLKDRLERDGVLNSRRIIFVCHSMGGIVARKFLLLNESLLKDLRIQIGLFLVASPSLGSQDANRGLVRILARAFGNSQVEALRFAQSNVWLNELDNSFMSLRERQSLAIAGKELVEDEPKFRWLSRRQVVEPFSAGRYFPDSFKVPYSNHTSIAKPENRDSRQHQLLCDFIRKYRYTSGAHRTFRKADLKIGLSSESPETIEWMLGICQHVMNVVLNQPDIPVPFNIAVEPVREYDHAFAAFAEHLERYDIVMLDDLWLPHFESHLRDLSDLDSFQEYFDEKKPFEAVFLKSLTGVCTRSNAPGRIFAVPVSGNVQLLMYRKDLLKAAGCTTDAPLLGDPDELLDFLVSPQAKAAAKRPFMVRYLTDNDLTENFWEILRAYGYEDQCGETGEVLIPTPLARKALEWLRLAHPGGQKDQLGWEDVKYLAGSSQSEAMMMFGWPVWVMPDLVRNPDSWGFLGMKQFIRRPITGFWSLAIPATSKYAEEAMKVILALTTVPELQFSMAEAGLVPVLREFPEPKLKKRYPAWKENFDIIRCALADGQPRPRTARWRDIEKELARQIRNGEFEDRKPLFRFIGDVKAAVK
jgi:ABC-type glycerol-3-phosphate transport system substrate-binding protein/pimeloyl-ACP methyl ester carboxylesterase